VTGLRWATSEAEPGAIAAALRDAVDGASLALENVALLQAAVGEEGIAAARHEIAAAFEGEPPPCHLVRQSPAGGRGIAALLWLYEGPVVRSGAVASIGRGPGRLHFVDGVSAPTGDVGAQWERCFGSLDAALREAGLAASSLVKLWTYYGSAGGDGHFPEFSAYRNRRFSRARFSIAPDSGAEGCPPAPASAPGGESRRWAPWLLPWPRRGR